MDEYISREAVLKKLQMQLLDLEADRDNGEYSELCENRGARDALDEAIYDIRTLKASDVQPIDRWIDAQKNPPPIIDRRSMTSESVLILRDNGRCSVAYYCNSAEDGDYWTTDDDKTMYCWEEVTHWQPLPELPKKRRSENDD